MIELSQRKLLAELKDKYDEILKQEYFAIGNGSFNNDLPYSEKYPYYFTAKYINGIVMKMRPVVYTAYKHGAGHELDVGKGGVPPKFLCIGSSALFCYESLEMNKDTKEGEGAAFFAHKHDKITNIEFEKELPVFNITNIINPHMDAYAKTENREYFFECKFHEMFDDHPMRVSQRYFNTGKDLITDHIPEEYLHLDEKIYNIDPEAFGLKGRSFFDVKQLLTHLMAIKVNKKMKECTLIYYYCFPNKKDIRDDRILEIIDRVKKDAITVFKSKLIKHYCDKNGIEIEMYVKTFDPYPASSKNTERIY